VEENKKRDLYWQDENRSASLLKIPEISYPSHHLIQPINPDVSAYAKLKKWIKQFKSLKK
jgi:hypothetical protein